MADLNINPGGEIKEAGNSKKTLTGVWRTGKVPKRIPEKCTHCATCFSFCPEGAIKFENKRMVGIDYDYCKGCGICAKECPFGALEMVEEKSND